MKPTDDLEARLRELLRDWDIAQVGDIPHCSTVKRCACQDCCFARLTDFIRERELGMRRDLAADARDRNVLWNALGRPEGTYTTSLAERAAKALAEKDAEIARLSGQLARPAYCKCGKPIVAHSGMRRCGE